MISQTEYQSRRQLLAKTLSPNAVAIISGSSEKLRNGDSHYRFRQASDFYYFTGFSEPDAVLIITNHPNVCSYLFNRPSNALQEQWTGKRLGQSGAVTQLNIDYSFAIETFAAKLPELLVNKSAIYHSLGENYRLDQAIITALAYLKSQARQSMHAPKIIHELSTLIGEARLIKSAGELDLIRQAVAVSIAAHKRVMQQCRNTQYEYQLEATFRYEANRAGCLNLAYEPIVGGGANSCILHYTDNNKRLRHGDLLLIDAACEYENYASDITRTYPINGEFNPAQKAIYTLVLKAQQAGIAAIKPNAPWSIVQEVIVKTLTQGLIDLGILTGSCEQLIALEAYKPFYMHSSGHWLGLDVHDSGSYKKLDQWRVFEPGMVLTVEPGLYFNAHMPGVDPCWWNIGVRIEDDILVTDTGHENLSADLPVSINAIEALMQEPWID